MNQKPEPGSDALRAPNAGAPLQWSRPLPETLPKPTAWPAVLAFGSCLAAFGVVTAWPISLAGFILFFAGAAGWIARMRDEQPK